VELKTNMNHHSANNALCLKKNIDVQQLNTDLQTCLKAQWKEHFNDNDYSGSWTVIALRSQTGEAQDIFAHQSAMPFKDTLLLAECGYFKEILDAMLFEKETVRLLRLQPGSVVKPHRDMGLAYRFGCFRLHIPLATHASVEFIVGGENIPMKAGECWYADFDKTHSVHNESAQERIHLVIDGKRNAWTDKLFADAGYDFEEEKREIDYSLETKKQMIEQLRLMKTDVADDMIKKLELEIAAGSHGHATD
jgi:hypothetical protein